MEDALAGKLVINLLVTITLLSHASKRSSYRPLGRYLSSSIIKITQSFMMILVNGFSFCCLNDQHISQLLVVGELQIMCACITL